MATNPDEARSREEEAAAAALLLGASYNLPQLIRTAKVRPRPFRRIEATEALRSSVAAPYFDLIRAWRAERDELLGVYASLLPARGQPLPADAAARIQTAVDRAAARVELAQLERRFPGILAQLERWHRAQWLARIRSSVGVDVAVLTPDRSTNPETDNAAVRNAQQLRAIHEEAKNRVSSMLQNSLIAFVPLAIVATSFNRGMDQSKARGARNAVDQTGTLVEALSRVRRREAGLARFRWHHTPQPRPRPEHRLRDKRIYSHSNAPNDRAGTLPFCKCWEEPLFD